MIRTNRSNFILLSDIHATVDRPVCRRDDVGEAVLRKLRFVLEYARAHECVVLQAGDFFDGARSWRTLPLIAELLAEFIDVDVCTIRGQHDMYMRSDTHATSLGVVEKSGLLIRIDNGIEHIGGCLQYERVAIHGVSYGDEIPEPEKDRMNILVIHKMIVDEPMWFGQEYTDAGAFLRKHKGFDIILCGDAHKKFLVRGHNKNRFICNTGCMMRLKANEADHVPGFFVVSIDDPHSMLWVKIPHEPAEKVISREHLEEKSAANEMLDSFIGAINSDKIDTVNYDDNLKVFLEKNGIEERVVNIITAIMEVEK